MAVSKRLRFEILRRDGFRCRYCGFTGESRELRVDHVIPEALGGTDDPGNLVTACEPCNSGKSSIAPDSPIVVDVAEDAERWARAIEIVAHRRAAQRMDDAEIHQQFYALWTSWKYTNSEGFRVPIALTGDWKRSVLQWLDAGLEMDDLEELIEIAMGSRSSDVWKYFCGCCWGRLRNAHEHAARIVARQKEAV